MAQSMPPLSNLQLQELIQHKNRQAADSRLTAGQYYDTHLVKQPALGSRDDFDRDLHVAEHDRLTKIADGHEAEAAQFRGDLLARQRGRGNSSGDVAADSSGPMRGGGGGSSSGQSDPADDLYRREKAARIEQKDDEREQRRAQQQTETKGKNR